MKTILPSVLICALALFWAAPAAVAQEIPSSPSFDCTKATHAFEVTICKDHNLAAMDQAIDKLYRSLPADDPGRHAHHVWNKLREDCGTDIGCIFDLQKRSLFSMHEKLEPWMREAARQYKRSSAIGRGGGDMGWGVHLPKVEGACTRTTFAVISDRFGGNPRAKDAAGTSALLSNGGYLVTYDTDKVLIESRVGDPVEMCLASIPVDCPPNDERGREYSITNLRTHGRTKLPDSQHACGGA